MPTNANLLSMTQWMELSRLLYSHDAAALKLADSKRPSAKLRATVADGEEALATWDAAAVSHGFANAREWYEAGAQGGGAYFDNLRRLNGGKLYRAPSL